MAESNWGGLRLAGGSWMPINCMVLTGSDSNTYYAATSRYTGVTWVDEPSYIRRYRKSREYISSYWSVNINAFANPSIPYQYDSSYVGTNIFDVEFFDGAHLVLHVDSATSGTFRFEKNGNASSGGATISPSGEYDLVAIIVPFINYTETSEVRSIVGFKIQWTSRDTNLLELFNRIESEFTSSTNITSNVRYISLLTLGGGTYTQDYSAIPSPDVNSLNIIISPTSFVYDGSPAEPNVIVTTKDGLSVLEENVDYTVSYHNNTAPGTGSVNVAGIGLYTGSATRYFYIWSTSSPPPYQGLPPAEVGGGSYTPPSASDTVNIPSVPQTDFSSVNFTRIYVPTKAELRDLATYMWSNQNFIDYCANTLKNIAGNPFEAIIALNVFPCAVPKGATEEVRVMFNPTGVHMSPALRQFITVNCGTLEIPRVYSSALDYNPYTTISLFLPFIGTVSLDADEVMGKTLRVTYRIDIITGTCVALIEVGSITMYQHSGVCCMTIPLTQSNYTTIVGAVFGVTKIAGSIALGVASGGVSLASAALGASTAAGLAAKLPGKTTSGMGEQGSQNFAASIGHAAQGLARSGVDNTVSAVMSGKNHIEHTGSFVGNAGFLGVRRPYVIIRRPNLVNPEDYGKYNGYPSLVSVNLSECSGYTEVQQIQLTGLAATNAECDEILRLLKGGVIF